MGSKNQLIIDYYVASLERLIFRESKRERERQRVKERE